MDINDFREFRDRQSWIFAKTYANRAPHEIFDRWDLTMECIRRQHEFLDRRNERIARFCAEHEF